ncbi:Uncharacterized protein APZ42_025514 [Daphnia magna]|uniref:Integrase catalytic domain-containing protein n=1 Tax=Daphnia magna TaxID=35525 RepID=A0A164T093_9CRUS|nr:Uncharacterized protein APZ42_025514 [Daphnia magna]
MCNKRKVLGGSKAPLYPLPLVEGVWERIAMDIMSPVQESDKGCKYILVFSDYASRTTAYHPQTDGLVERFNRTLCDMLACYFSDQPANWDKYLPFVTFAYNTAKQASTQETPFFLFFGRKPIIPNDIKINRRYQTYEDTSMVYSQQWEKAQKLARKHLFKSRYNPEKKITGSFWIGSFDTIYSKETKLITPVECWQMVNNKKRGENNIQVWPNGLNFTAIPATPLPSPVKGNVCKDYRELCKSRSQSSLLREVHFLFNTQIEDEQLGIRLYSISYAWGTIRLVHKKPKIINEDGKIVQNDTTIYITYESGSRNPLITYSQLSKDDPLPPGSKFEYIVDQTLRVQNTNICITETTKYYVFAATCSEESTRWILEKENSYLISQESEMCLSEGIDETLTLEQCAMEGDTRKNQQGFYQTINTNPDVIENFPDVTLKDIQEVRLEKRRAVTTTVNSPIFGGILKATYGTTTAIKTTVKSPSPTTRPTTTTKPTTTTTKPATTTTKPTTTTTTPTTTTTRPTTTTPTTTTTKSAITEDIIMEIIEDTKQTAQQEIPEAASLTLQQIPEVPINEETLENCLPKNINEFNDRIKFEITKMHEQYKISVETEHDKKLAKEIRDVYCQLSTIKRIQAVILAQGNGILTASTLGLPIFSRLQGFGQTMTLQQCKAKRIFVSAKGSRCGFQPFFTYEDKNCTIGVDGWSIHPYSDCFWKTHLVNFNGFPHTWEHNSTDGDWIKQKANIHIPNLDLITEFEELNLNDFEYGLKSHPAHETMEMEQLKILNNIVNRMQESEEIQYRI